MNRVLERRFTAEYVRPAPLPLGVRPRVSVVIPTYNYARYLPEAIDSALSQGGVEVEVIVVDDASTDDSVVQAHRYGDRIRVIQHERNRGAVATFNTGLASATGDYLVRLDADDVLTPGSLARSATLAEAKPNVGLIYGRPIHFRASRPPARSSVRRWRITSGDAWLDLRCRAGVNCITAPEAFMRMSVVNEVGGQRDLAHTHDMEMWMRIARASDVGWIDGADQAWHREHSASLSSTSDVIGDLCERLDAFSLLFTDELGDPDENASRLEVAKLTLATEALRRAIAAFVRGRGDQPEVAEYLEFVTRSGADPSTTPEARMIEMALRLGPTAAQRSPLLLAWAVGNRARAALARRRWERTGL